MKRKTFVIENYNYFKEFNDEFKREYLAKALVSHVMTRNSTPHHIQNERVLINIFKQNLQKEINKYRALLETQEIIKTIPSSDALILSGSLEKYNIKLTRDLNHTPNFIKILNENKEFRKLIDGCYSYESLARLKYQAEDKSVYYIIDTLKLNDLFYSAQDSDSMDRIFERIKFEADENIDTRIVFLLSKPASNPSDDFDVVKEYNLDFNQNLSTEDKAEMTWKFFQDLLKEYDILKFEEEKIDKYANMAQNHMVEMLKLYEKEIDTPQWKTEEEKAVISFWKEKLNSKDFAQEIETQAARQTNIQRRFDEAKLVLAIQQDFSQNYHALKKNYDPLIFAKKIEGTDENFIEKYIRTMSQVPNENNLFFIVSTKQRIK